MKKQLLCSVLLMCVTVSHAEPNIQFMKVLDSGILSKRITITPLTESERQSLKKSGGLRATAHVYAKANNVTVVRGHRGTAHSYHSVCFETWLTTEADYKFTLDLGGDKSEHSDHIVIKNDRRTCVEYQLYKNFVFTFPGGYEYYATTTGTTKMAGEARANAKALIWVTEE